jgi:DNA polymerase (family 10)
VNNQRIAARFLEIADHLESAGANPYRIRAYRKAAESLKRLKDDASVLAERGQLEQIPGIGPDLAAKIDEFLRTGEIQDPGPDRAAELPMDEPGSGSIPLPPEFLELIELGPLDPRLVRSLARRFLIESVEDLERLARSRLLRTLPNVGVPWEKKILKAIKAYRNLRASGSPPSDP